MSLATYLKNDIDSFFDEIKEQGPAAKTVREEEFSMFTIEKDYAELTEQAFDKNDTNSIEKMLKELQTQADNDLLEEDLHEKIVSVLREVEDIILKRINEVDSPALHGEAQNILTRRKRDSVTKQEKDELFTKGILAIKNFLEKKEIEQAKLAYQRLVKDFKTYSSGSESEAWRQRIFSAFELIKETQKRLEKEKIFVSEKQKMKIDSIKAKISLVIEGLGSIDPFVLENKLVEVKQDIISTHLSKDQGEAFLPILRTLVSKINFLKQAKEKEFLIEQKKIAEKKEAEKAKREAEKIISEKDSKEEKISDVKKGDIHLSKAEIDMYEKALDLLNQGEYDKANKLYKELLKKNPDNIRAEIRLMEIANKKKRNERHVV